MSKTQDQRGFFGYADFKDTYGSTVRVKESSADPLDKVWVFIDAEHLHMTMPFSTGADTFDGFPAPRTIYIDPVTHDLVPMHGVTAQKLGRQHWPKLKQSAAAHLSLEQAKVLRGALDEWIRDQEFANEQGLTKP